MEPERSVPQCSAGTGNAKNISGAGEEVQIAFNLSKAASKKDAGSLEKSHSQRGLRLRIVFEGVP